MQLRSTEINIYKVKRIAVQWQNEKDGYNGPAYIRVKTKNLFPVDILNKVVLHPIKEQVVNNVSTELFSCNNTVTTLLTTCS
jgi:hypothetical protein